MSTFSDPNPYRPRAWSTEQAHVQIEHSWSDDLHVGVSGFAVVKTGRPQDLRILCEGQPPAQLEWLDRPDVPPFFPDHLNHDRCGFRAWFHRRASHVLNLSFPHEAGKAETDLRFDATGFPDVKWDDLEVGTEDDLYDWFNRECKSVLEIGSRVVSPDSASKRGRFDPGIAYTGFDYFPDSNTDVVGDAHRLSRYFPPDQRFDGIFSLAVMEHLAMPWVVPVEINRLLPIGGLTFHSTVFTWPLHERPWDFWRFTDQALRVLFNPGLGYEVVFAGMSDRCRIHPEDPDGLNGFTPTFYTWMNAFILARKVRELPADRVKWDISMREALPTGELYPSEVNPIGREKGES